jgi:hypothetical protein
MWKTVPHGMDLKMVGPERTRFSRRGNLIEIKDAPPNGGGGGWQLRSPKLGFARNAKSRFNPHVPA